MFMEFANRVSDQSDDRLEASAMKILAGEIVPQFESHYLLCAFAFLFPYSIGAPDLKRQSRHRRPAANKLHPLVDFVEQWSSAISKRVEGQFRRDMTCIFAVWNLVFRTIVNLGASLKGIYELAGQDGVKGTEIRDAAVAIMHALDDTYETPNGMLKFVCIDA